MTKPQAPTDRVMTMEEAQAMLSDPATLVLVPPEQAAAEPAPEPEPCARCPDWQERLHILYAAVSRYVRLKPDQVPHRFMGGAVRVRDTSTANDVGPMVICEVREDAEPDFGQPLGSAAYGKRADVRTIVLNNDKTVIVPMWYEFCDVEAWPGVLEVPPSA